MDPIVDHALCKKILEPFKQGISPAKICQIVGMSETAYNRLLKRHPELFNKAKKLRLMNQKKKRNLVQTNLHGEKTDSQKNKTKITPEEKIRALEIRLAKEQKKNAELETLLEVAKEYLGKF